MVELRSAINQKSVAINLYGPLALSLRVVFLITPFHCCARYTLSPSTSIHAVCTRYQTTPTRLAHPTLSASVRLPPIAFQVPFLHLNDLPSTATGTPPSTTHLGSGHGAAQARWRFPCYQPDGHLDCGARRQASHPRDYDLGLI